MLEVWSPLEIYYFCLTYDLVPVGLAVVCLVGLDVLGLGVDLRKIAEQSKYKL